MAVAVFCIGLLSCTGLGVALVVSLVDKGGAKVDVTGVSTEQVRSDQVQWSFTIKSESANRSQGALIQEKQVSQAIAFLEKNNISPKDIFVKVLFASPNIETNRETGRETMLGWKFSQEIVVISSDVDKVAEVSRRSSELISNGVDARFQMPRFTYSGLADKRIELLKEATENAKQRAKAIATTGSLSLGRMTNVGTATFQVTAPGSSSAGSGGLYDTDTIEKEVSAVMDVSFRLK